MTNSTVCQSKWKLIVEPRRVKPAKDISSNKSQKGLPLETKNTQNHENWRLGLICNTVVCICPRPLSTGLSDFQKKKKKKKQDGLNDPKENKI